jgi:hypothetical protein
VFDPPVSLGTVSLYTIYFCVVLPFGVLLIQYLVLAGTLECILWCEVESTYTGIGL